MTGSGRRETIAPEFDALDDRNGLEIVDPVERVRFELWTSGPVEPATAPTDSFPYPMGSAVTVRTGHIEVPKLADVLVRDSDGVFVTEYSTADDREVVPPGAYDLDLTTAPLKLHLLVDSDLEIYRTEGTSVVIDFGDVIPVTVGARSFHDRPAGTITVPDGVEALMDAVSLFGSALKTTSPERSFPTLRGHPPRIRLGDRFRTSKGIDLPDTGVTLVVPPERKAVYAAAPLAFYLGAEVVPGRWPRLETADFEREFPRPSREVGWDREADDFERAIHRTLKHVFFLDCVIRTEGLYPVDLYEREAFEERTDLELDFAELYEMYLDERLEAYLDVPHVDVKPFLPTWNLLVDVVPSAERDQLLSYLVDDLALIRCTPPPEHRQLRPNDELSIKLHGKQGPMEPPSADDPDLHHMSYAGKPFDPAPTEAIEHAHAGDGYPRNSNKLSLKAFENQLEAPPSDDATVRVHVVCNDLDVKERGLLSAVYGDRNLLDFEVSYDYLPTTDELIEILERPIDLLHFVGETTEEGLVCKDGVVRPIDVYPLGVRSFFVQQCRDYGDLEWLIDRGAFGGVAVTSAIGDSDESLEMGRWMARLLNSGFTLRSAGQVVRQVFPDGMEYVTLGDGGVSLTHPRGAQPQLNVVENVDDSYKLTLKAYLSDKGGLGAVWWPIIDGYQSNRLVPTELSSIKLEQDELLEYLERVTGPADINGEYMWTDLSNLDYYI